MACVLEGNIDGNEPDVISKLVDELGDLIEDDTILEIVRRYMERSYEMGYRFGDYDGRNRPKA
jgi:hypothetical protein